MYFLEKNFIPFFHYKKNSKNYISYLYKKKYDEKMCQRDVTDRVIG